MDIRRRHVALIIAATALIAVLIRPEFLSDVCLFVFLGIIPGSMYTLPAWVSLLGCTIALILAIRWLFDQPTYRPVPTAKDRARRASARKRVLKTTSQVTHPQLKARRQTSKA